MALTTILKNSKIRKLFKDNFNKPNVKLTDEIKAKPLSENHLINGIAFEHLMKFYLNYYYPEAVESEWRAERNMQLWGKLKKDGSMWNLRIPVMKLTKNILEIVKNDYNQYLETGELTESLIGNTIFLARAEYYNNYGLDIPALIQKPIDKNDIKDLKNIFSLLDIEIFNTTDKVFLSPSFNEGSVLVGDATADLIIGNRLIDIKTTKKNGFTLDMFLQLIGYYILAQIGGIGEQKVDGNTITELGIYFSRYGYLYTFKIEDVVDIQNLPEFIDIFKSQVSKVKDHLPGYRAVYEDLMEELKEERGNLITKKIMKKEWTKKDEEKLKQIENIFKLTNGKYIEGADKIKIINQIKPILNYSS